jgi:hypothetical protein
VSRAVKRLATAADFRHGMATETLAPAESAVGGTNVPRFLRERALLLGVTLYAAVALADGLLTLRGMGGDLELEGNPVMRAAMRALGLEMGLLVQKVAMGAVGAAVAYWGAPAIRKRSPWIWRVPMTPPVRRWLKRGDRSWIAFIPLYAAIAAQAFAVASWTALYLLE